MNTLKTTFLLTCLTLLLVANRQRHRRPVRHGGRIRQQPPKLAVSALSTFSGQAGIAVGSEPCRGGAASGRPDPVRYV